jgi:hypothetical protein
MAATSIATLIRQVRISLRDELTQLVSGDPYWSDQEICDYMTDGMQILWRAIVDLYDHHFTVVDEENMYIEANVGRVYGVPDTVHRVTTLEPRVVGPDNPNPSVVFTPADWNSNNFTVARAQRASSPRGMQIFYTLMAEGAPVSAPVIRIAPRVTEGMLLSCTYVSTLVPLTLGGYNPIPGQSDAALKAYAMAYCYAKTREDNKPDPGWLAIFATERTDLMAKLDKRQDQQPDIVEGMFEPAGAAGGWEGGFQ